MSDERENTGNWNTGNWNTGDRNTGNWNTGNRNTGNWNTGNWNTGNRNTGNRNTENWNTGDWNTGNWNTGNWNTGNRNTGNRNTGNWNTGDWNTGDWNTGDLNTNSPTVRLFNFDSGWVFDGEKHRRLRRTLRQYQKDLCEWVYEKDMSKREKEDNPTHKTTGGYLKVNGTTYNGKEVTKEDRDFLESIPNFCPKILKQCTGIVFGKKHIITIDGKDIEISEESFKELKRVLNDNII